MILELCVQTQSLESDSAQCHHSVKLETLLGRCCVFQDTLIHCLKLELVIGPFSQ